MAFGSWHFSKSCLNMYSIYLLFSPIFSVQFRLCMRTVVQPLWLFPIVFGTPRETLDSLLPLYYPHLPSLNLKAKGNLCRDLHWSYLLRISSCLPVAALCTCIPFSLENGGTAGSPVCFCLPETFLNSPSLAEGLFGRRQHSWGIALAFHCSNPPPLPFLCSAGNSTQGVVHTR